MAFGINRFHLFTSQMRAGGPEIPGVTRGAWDLLLSPTRAWARVLSHPAFLPSPPWGCRGMSRPRGQHGRCPKVWGPQRPPSHRESPEQTQTGTDLTLLCSGDNFHADARLWGDTPAHPLPGQGKE